MIGCSDCYVEKGLVFDRVIGVKLKLEMIRFGSLKCFQK